MSRSDPSPEELAAIVAAVEMAWPRPVVVEDDRRRTSPWRFSNRWWMPRRAPAASRQRP
ncbi:MAG TPA: hypothetical protein VHN98_02560 [Acidimicrobiales bacterium]|nr:hypothetical protein [Acidimicrobiales bacterium]